jgi:hypothetical protein
MLVINNPAKKKLKWKQRLSGHTTYMTAHTTTAAVKRIKKIYDRIVINSSFFLHSPFVSGLSNVYVTAVSLTVNRTNNKTKHNLPNDELVSLNILFFFLKLSTKSFSFWNHRQEIS